MPALGGRDRVQNRLHAGHSAQHGGDGSGASTGAPGMVPQGGQLLLELVLLRADGQGPVLPGFAADRPLQHSMVELARPYHRAVRRPRPVDHRQPEGCSRSRRHCRLGHPLQDLQPSRSPPAEAFPCGAGAEAREGLPAVGHAVDRGLHVRAVHDGHHPHERHHDVARARLPEPVLQLARERHALPLLLRGGLQDEARWPKIIPDGQQPHVEPPGCGGGDGGLLRSVGAPAVRPRPRDDQRCRRRGVPEPRRHHPRDEDPAGAPHRPCAPSGASSAPHQASPQAAHRNRGGDGRHGLGADADVPAALRVRHRLHDARRPRLHLRRSAADVGRGELRHRFRVPAEPVQADERRPGGGHRRHHDLPGPAALLRLHDVGKLDDARHPHLCRQRQHDQLFREGRGGGQEAAGERPGRAEDEEPDGVL
mmetsp:Transcript_1509/g.2965  ORF Transcript_1509/g.2965 Transcript_1509/m.2965 type:complete len:423 (+) Transcript_1509:575-1843(+)